MDQDSHEETVAAVEKLLGLRSDRQRAYLRQELKRLEDIASSVRLEGISGPPSQRAKRFRSAASACDRILKIFEIDGDTYELDAAVSNNTISRILAFNLADIVNPNRRRHPPLEDDASREHIERTLRSIITLRAAAQRGEAEAEKQQKQGLGGNRNYENWPRKEFTRHALILYFELTGRKPGTSRGSLGGKVGGPAGRFLNIMLPAFCWPVKSNTARDLINELKDESGLLDSANTHIFKSKKF